MRKSLEIKVPKNFCLKTIANSGQCFRMEGDASGKYEIVAFHKVLHAGQSECGGVLSLNCTKSEFEDIWSGYFDLGTDYEGIQAMIDPKDDFLFEAAENGRGIRILRQDPWETLITFIISQRKSIPAIKKAVRLLCEAAGSPIESGRGSDGDRSCETPAEKVPYSFPTPEQIAQNESKVAECGLGYRLPYVLGAASRFACGELRVSELERLDDEELYEALTGISGVGPKVASCTMLFGFHRMDLFPEDVWIKRALEDHYPSGFPKEKYSPWNGVMQQYIFFGYQQGKVR